VTVAASLLILGAVIAAPPSEIARGPAWATVTRAPAFRWEGIVLEFGNLDEPVAGSRTAPFYVRRTATRGRSVRLSWADSRSCPELAGVVAGLRAFPAPQAARGRSSSNGHAGMRYTLARASQQSLFGDVESRLGQWTDQALQQLAACWRTTPPDHAAAA
jgi:hypothetical protein